MGKLYKTKGMKLLLAVLLLTMGLSLKVFAVPTATRANFAAGSYSTTSLRVDVAVPDGYRAQVEVYTYGGTPVGNDYATSSYNYAYISAKFAKNTVYMYRIRYYEHKLDPKTYKYIDTYGAWSPLKAFCMIEPKLSLTSKKSSTVKVKIPKISGVNRVVMYMSTSKTKGYKKVLSIKPGKTKKIAKFKGKKFTFYKTYYYKLKFSLKNKVPCEVYMNNFYLYKTWG